MGNTLGNANSEINMKRHKETVYKQKGEGGFVTYCRNSLFKMGNDEEQTSNKIRASQVNQHILLVDLTPD